jgi:malonyl-CoA O-methyltransferase
MQMQNPKNKVCDRFNRAAKSYDTLCQVQNNICDLAIQMLRRYSSNFNIVVDMACGTGESTKKIVEQLNIATCFAVDFSSAMLDMAKNKLSTSKISWLCCDYATRINVLHQTDLIFCNMGLQWAEDLSSVLQNWRNYLTPHGIIIYTVPLQNNFPEIKDNYKTKFLSHAENIALLQQSGWEVMATELYKESLEFTDCKSIFRYLQLTGVNCNKLHYNCQGLRKNKLTDFLISPQVNTLNFSVGIYMARKI